MLHKFLVAHRTDLVARCRAKVARRATPKVTAAELDHGIPMFLGQLITTLRAEPPPHETRRTGVLCVVGNAEPADTVADTDIHNTATLHGLDLMKQGFTIDQVVHDYGDLCQAITELASQTGAPITVEEFRTLNRCLDDAIASAVTEFSSRHDFALASSNLQLSDGRSRTLLHEMLTHVNTATLAITAIKGGNVGLQGATGAILDLSMVSMRRLIERSLPQEQDTVGALAQH